MRSGPHGTCGQAGTQVLGSRGGHHLKLLSRAVEGIEQAVLMVLWAGLKRQLLLGKVTLGLYNSRLCKV